VEPGVLWPPGQELPAHTAAGRELERLYAVAIDAAGAEGDEWLVRGRQLLKGEDLRHNISF
jgi:hypothetical protein